MTNVFICEIGIGEYLTELSELRTPLSDFYIKTRNCEIIAAFGEEKRCVGFLLAEQKALTEILLLTSARDDAGIKKQMLDFLVKSLSPGGAVRWRIIAHPADEQAALDYGFRPESTLHLFRTIRYGEGPEQDLLQKLYRLSDSVEKRGYRTVCFSQLTEEQKEQISKDPDREFAPELRPGSLMEDRSGGVSHSLSTAALKDGRVVAYSIIRAPAKSRCIFEILCVAKSRHKSGVIVLPIVRSVRELLAGGYDALTFAVYDRNREMLSVIERNFSPVIESRRIQRNMVFYSDKNA